MLTLKPDPQSSHRECGVQRPTIPLQRCCSLGTHDVSKPSKNSGSRLELALLGTLPSNLLLLDEPTNHLDIPAREALETFLRESPATVLIVSHDRRLLETLCDRLWVVDRGLAAPFDGGYRAWRAAIAEGWTVATAVEAEAKRLHAGGARGHRPSIAPPVAVAAARSRRRQADSPATGGRGPATTSAPSIGRRGDKLSKDAYRRQKTIVDGDLTRLGLRKNHLELALADPTVAANFVELRRITSELADVELALGAAEEAWLELEERAP